MKRRIGARMELARFLQVGVPGGAAGCCMVRGSRLLWRGPLLRPRPAPPRAFTLWEHSIACIHPPTAHPPPHELVSAGHGGGDGERHAEEPQRGDCHVSGGAVPLHAAPAVRPRAPRAAPRAHACGMRCVWRCHGTLAARMLPAASPSTARSPPRSPHTVFLSTSAACLSPHPPILLQRGRGCAGQRAAALQQAVQRRADAGQPGAVRCACGTTMCTCSTATPTGPPAPPSSHLPPHLPACAACRVQLVSLCRFVGIQPFGTDAFLRARLRRHLLEIKVPWDPITNGPAESRAEAEALALPCLPQARSVVCLCVPQAPCRQLGGPAVPPCCPCCPPVPPPSSCTAGGRPGHPAGGAGEPD